MSVESMALGLGPIPLSIVPVGSRMTCSPPPLNTDRDWLALIPKERYDEFANFLLGTGWEVGGSFIPSGADNRDPDAHFNSFTKGVDNVITTASEAFQRRFLAASAIAKRHNLMEKYHRIELFQAVLYGAICDPVFEPAGYAFSKELEEIF